MIRAEACDGVGAGMTGFEKAATIGEGIFKGFGCGWLALWLAGEVMVMVGAPALGAIALLLYWIGGDELLDVVGRGIAVAMPWIWLAALVGSVGTLIGFCVWGARVSYEERLLEDLEIRRAIRDEQRRIYGRVGDG